MLERMKKEIDKKLRQNQVGFRAKRSCTDHIATLRIIKEQSIEWNSGLYLNFSDYKQAFDETIKKTIKIRKWKWIRHVAET
jgi:hypothetical protein